MAWINKEIASIIGNEVWLNTNLPNNYRGIATDTHRWCHKYSGTLYKSALSTEVLLADGTNPNTGDLDLDGYSIIMDQDGDTKIVNDRDGGVSDDQLVVRIAGIDTQIWTTTGLGLGGLTGAQVAGLLHTAAANANNQTYLDCYDDGASYSKLNFRKSDTDTIGTAVQTDSADLLGEIKFHGVNTTPSFAMGAFIHAKQNGAAVTQVPTDLIFSTYSNSAENANQLVLHNSGSIGINTNDPDALWHVQRSRHSTRPSFTDNTVAIFEDSTHGEGAACFISIISEANDWSGIFFGIAGLGANENQASLIWKDDFDKLLVEVNNIEIIKFLENSGQGLIYTENTQANVNGNDFYFRKSRGANAAAADGDTVGTLKFDFLNDGAPKEWITGAKIQSIVTDITDGTEDAYLVLSTIGNGTLTEHMRITESGRVGFGSNEPASAIEINNGAGGTDMGYITIQELSGDAAAPAANEGAIYLKDNGSGKTQLCVRFNTGAVQVLATEP